MSSDYDASIFKDHASDLLEAIRTLATMTKHAPSYEVTVVPFATAHQDACRVLERLQAAGFEEAN
jgi:hypothetical protein